MAEARTVNDGVKQLGWCTNWGLTLDEIFIPRSTERKYLPKQEYLTCIA